MGVCVSSPYPDPSTVPHVPLTHLPKNQPIIVGDSSRQSSRKLRFVVVSDTHNEIEKVNIPEGDVFIHCGDATKWYNSGGDILKFNEFLGKLPHAHKIVIAGNHDFGLQKSDVVSKMTNCSYLQDSFITIEGLKIWGTPWHVKRTILHRASAFGVSDDAIKHKWALIPNDVDILITHQPPLNVLDVNHNGKNMGSTSLLDTVKEKRPKLHLFGHNHEGHGAAEYTDTNGKIVFINAANCIVSGHFRDAIVFDYYLPTFQ